MAFWYFSGYSMYNQSCCIINLPFQVTRDSWTTNTMMVPIAPLGRNIAGAQAIPGKKEFFDLLFFVPAYLYYHIHSHAKHTDKPMVGFTRQINQARKWAEKLRSNTYKSHFFSKFILLIIHHSILSKLAIFSKITSLTMSLLVFFFLMI